MIPGVREVVELIDDLTCFVVQVVDGGTLEVVGVVDTSEVDGPLDGDIGSRGE